MLRNYGIFDTVVQNDTYPTYTYTFLDDEVPLDISSPSAIIEIKMVKPNEPLPVTLSLVGKTGNVGEVFWKFQPGDIDAPGTYKFQLRISFSGKTYTSVENLYLRVLSEV